MAYPKNRTSLGQQTGRRQHANEMNSKPACLISESDMPSRMVANRKSTNTGRTHLRHIRKLSRLDRQRLVRRPLSKSGTKGMAGMTQLQWHHDVSASVINIALFQPLFGAAVADDDAAEADGGGRPVAVAAAAHKAPEPARAKQSHTEPHYASLPAIRPAPAAIQHCLLIASNSNAFPSKKYYLTLCLLQFLIVSHFLSQYILLKIYYKTT